MFCAWFPSCLWQLQYGKTLDDLYAANPGLTNQTLLTLGGKGQRAAERVLMRPTLGSQPMCGMAILSSTKSDYHSFFPSPCSHHPHRQPLRLHLRGFGWQRHPPFQLCH